MVWLMVYVRVSGRRQQSTGKIKRSRRRDGEEEE